MFKVFAVLMGVLSFQNVFAGVSGSTDVLARYYNSYRGDDDYYVHCLVENTGDVTLIGQGLQTVHVHHQKANSQLIAKLKSQLAGLNVKKDDQIKYEGYNFLNVGENMQPAIAVFKDSTVGGLSSYFNVKMDSAIADTVKKACRIEEPAPVIRR